LDDAALKAVAALAGGLDASARGRLVEYGRLVTTSGRRWNLMSPRALARLDEHIVDSAAVLSVLDTGQCALADLGSGAGLPGVVLAILRPETNVSLVDSRRSKIVFLEHAVRELGLENAEVVHARLEDLPGGREFDLAVSRALGRVENTLEPSLALLRAGGRLVLFKGPKWAAEREAAEAAAVRYGAVLEREVDVELPGFGRTTTFVVFSAGGRSGD
jgi:16S rRNA (guanine527-N7)-methyltransferase